MLDLVELRAKLLRLQAMKNNPYEVRDAWMIFINAVNGKDTNTFLHVILKEEKKLEFLAPLLGDLARWIMREYPPEKTYKREHHETP